MDFFAGTEAERLFLYHCAETLFGEEFVQAAGEIRSEIKKGGIAVEIRFGGKAASAFEIISEEKHFSYSRAASAALGKAFFLAANRFPFCRRAPYGTLVGVKPVKIALYYLNQGLSSEKVEAILEEEYFVFPEKAKLLTRLAGKEKAISFSEKEAMLYLSIPFCPSRCRYCSFVSSSIAGKENLIPAYLDAMAGEIRGLGEIVREKEIAIRGIYIGGGTPGTLSAKQFSDLIGEIRRNFPLSENTEFTVEIGRPDTVTREKLLALHEDGVERICINPQTMHDAVLRENGRCHTALQFEKAYATAREIGFRSINCDLIAGLAGDSAEGFLQSVKAILRLKPENLTLHALCHKNAAEARKISEIPHIAEAMEEAIALCINEGFSPYYLYRQKNASANMENIGFEAGGNSCLYNLCMMEDLCTVFAAGAGAGTKILRTKPDGSLSIRRFFTYKYPYEYLSGGEKIRRNLQEIQEIL